MKKKRSKLQWLACLLVAAVLITVGTPAISARAEDELAGGTPSTEVDLIDEGEGGQYGSRNALGMVAGTSVSQMQKQVISGQAPKDVVRVDKAHVPGQQPHIHFQNGTSINQDGTTHDAHKGIPVLTNKIREWILNNGWGINE